MLDEISDRRNLASWGGKTERDERRVYSEPQNVLDKLRGITIPALT